MIRVRQSIYQFSEKQIEYIIENFSKTSCRRIATHLNKIMEPHAWEVSPSRVFSIARLARISAQRKIQKLIDEEKADDALRIQSKLDELLPKSKIGNCNHE